MPFQLTPAEAKKLSKFNHKGYVKVLNDFSFVLHGKAVEVIAGQDLTTETWLSKGAVPLFIPDGHKVPGLQWEALNDRAVLKRFVEEKHLQALTTTVHSESSDKPITAHQKPNLVAGISGISKSTKMPFLRVLEYAEDCAAKSESSHLLAALNILVASEPKLDTVTTPPDFILQAVSWAHHLWPTFSSQAGIDKGAFMFGPGFAFVPSFCCCPAAQLSRRPS